MSKRMFSDAIVESDAFLDMPLTSQALYLHLVMNADNDGFVNPKRIMRLAGANDDDLRILIAKRFILAFDSGVVVVKHWWINNTKRLDRYVPTTYQTELAELVVKDNKSYTRITTQLQLGTDEEDTSATERQPNGNQRVPEAMFNAAHVHVQSNPMQPTPRQPVADKPRDFKKLKGEDAKRYAKAVQADKALAEKEQQARTRKPTTTTHDDVTNLFGGTHGPA